MIRTTLFLAAALLGLTCVDAAAAEVKVSYKGIVTQANGAQASSFPAGQEITFDYVIETTSPDNNPDTQVGLYYSGLREMSISVPGAGLVAETGAGTISVNNDVLNPDPSDYVSFSGYATSGNIANAPLWFASLAFSEYGHPGETVDLISNDSIPTTHLLAYNTNVSFWTSAGWTTLRILAEPDITCASEGYTGTKLYYCKKICESGYSGATLDMWLHRWTDRYRPELPYCAAQ